jgi:hypothetical protein
LKELNEHKLSKVREEEQFKTTNVEDGPEEDEDDSRVRVVRGLSMQMF